jgi:hypothetical protein
MYSTVKGALDLDSMSRSSFDHTGPAFLDETDVLVMKLGRLAPLVAILSTTAWPPLSSRSVITTLAPSRAGIAAQAAPIPDAPPVTMATLPST